MSISTGTKSGSEPWASELHTTVHTSRRSDFRDYVWTSAALLAVPGRAESAPAQLPAFP